MVGLYNTYGRIPTKIRSLIFKISGGRFKFLDPRVRNEKIGNERRDTWFLDQYKNPHESKHTIGEVLGWFDRTGFDFTNSIPKSAGFVPFSPEEKRSILTLCRDTRCSNDYIKGYGGCGLLVVFKHGCPNNSVPILWYDNQPHWERLFLRKSS